MWQKSYSPPYSSDFSECFCDHLCNFSECHELRAHSGRCFLVGAPGVLNSRRARRPVRIDWPLVLRIGSEWKLGFFDTSAHRTTIVRGERGRRSRRGRTRTVLRRSRGTSGRGRAVLAAEQADLHRADLRHVARDLILVHVTAVRHFALDEHVRALGDVLL